VHSPTTRTLSGALELTQEMEMTQHHDFPGHSVVFDESTDHRGVTSWNVFHIDEGPHVYKVLIGKIMLNEHGSGSPLLFVGACEDDLSEDLDPEAELLFSSEIESRFIYQVADFMRETEKRMVETDGGDKLLE
jgi:hypothetical protein